MSENLQCNASMWNRSKSAKLVQTGGGLSWGKWTQAAPENIAPGVTASGPHSSGRQGTASGTEGWVQYQLGDDASNWAKFSWDVPWTPGSANTYRTDVGSDSVIISVDGWHGSDASEAPVVSIALLG